MIQSDVIKSYRLFIISSLSPKKFHLRYDVVHVYFLSLFLKLQRKKTKQINKTNTYSIIII